MMIVGNARIVSGGRWLGSDILGIRNGDQIRLIGRFLSMGSF